MVVIVAASNKRSFKTVIEHTLIDGLASNTWKVFCQSCVRHCCHESLQFPDSELVGSFRFDQMQQCVMCEDSPPSCAPVSSLRHGSDGPRDPEQ